MGIMQKIIGVIGGALQKLLGTSKSESMAAAANIFVGQSDAALVVKPFLSKMTESELFAVMCGGLASISGSVLAGIATLGVPVPYLVAASFMAAPAGLLFAKMIVPQTEKFNDNIAEITSEDRPANALEAISHGAEVGIKIVGSAAAMLVAFVALISMINGMLSGVGEYVFDDPTLSLGHVLGFIFKPLAWTLGVPWNEAAISGEMIGTKLAINEFYAYIEFKNLYLVPDAAIQLSEKTKAIITFALCGFANFGSVAILIGGFGTMAPNRRGDIARLGIRAVIAGTLANLLSATIAGIFIGLGGAITI